jgi:hypothetical protein
MARFKNPLNHVRIAAPCPADWDQMIGDERVRFCGQCSLNVFNLSSMTRSDAESLIARNEGRLCVRFYRRSDGSIITKDCPVGLRAIRRRVSYVAKAISSMVLGLFAGLGVHGAFTSSANLVSRRTIGIMVAPADLSRPPIPQGRRTATVGEMGVKPTRHRAPSVQKAGTTPPVK